MQKNSFLPHFFGSLAILVLFSSCFHGIKVESAAVYSQHLRKSINLTILQTPTPENKDSFNLLLVNDGQDIEQFRLRPIMDSLHTKQLLKPLLVVAINAYDRLQQYGVVGYPDYKHNGTEDGAYAAFVVDELIPYIQRKSGVQHFHSITLAGCSLGGLSAFDIAWDHANLIDKVGVFSGSFWYRDKDDADSSYRDDRDRVIINKIRASANKPHLKYWFYAGGNEETADRDKDGIIDVIDDTKDLMDLIKSKNICPPDDVCYTQVRNGTHDYASWSHILPRFLLWADGK